MQTTVYGPAPAGPEWFKYLDPVSNGFQAASILVQHIQVSELRAAKSLRILQDRLEYGRIIVTEDDETVRSFLKRALELDGHSVDVAEDGGEAVATREQTRKRLNDPSLADIEDFTKRLNSRKPSGLQGSKTTFPGQFVFTPAAGFKRV